MSEKKPAVLFLCVKNGGKSQMALGWFAHLAGDQATSWSGGSEPAAQLNARAVEAMAEKGIDISHEYPKPWTDERIQEADVVITMGCGETCPYFPGRRYEEWEINKDVPEGLDGTRMQRDEIEGRVRTLMEELGLTPVA